MSASLSVRAREPHGGDHRVDRRLVGLPRGTRRTPAQQVHRLQPHDGGVGVGVVGVEQRGQPVSERERGQAQRPTWWESTTISSRHVSAQSPGIVSRFREQLSRIARPPPTSLPASVEKEAVEANVVRDLAHRRGVSIRRSTFRGRLGSGGGTRRRPPRSKSRERASRRKSTPTHRPRSFARRPSRIRATRPGAANRRPKEVARNETMSSSPTSTSSSEGRRRPPVERSSVLRPRSFMSRSRTIWHGTSMACRITAR